MRICTVNDIELMIESIQTSDNSISQYAARKIAIQFLSRPEYIIISPCDKCILILKKFSDISLEVHLNYFKPIQHFRKYILQTIEEIFQETQYSKIIIFIPEDLKSLIRLLKKLSFEYEGLLKKAIKMSGTARDLHIYSLNK